MHGSLPGECQDSLDWSRGGLGDSLRRKPPSLPPLDILHRTQRTHRRGHTANRNVSQRDPLRDARCNPVRSRDHRPTSRNQPEEYYFRRGKQTRLVTLETLRRKKTSGWTLPQTRREIQYLLITWTGVCAYCKAKIKRARGS